MSFELCGRRSPLFPPDLIYLVRHMREHKDSRAVYNAILPEWTDLGRRYYFSSCNPVDNCLADIVLPPSQIVRPRPTFSWEWSPNLQRWCLRPLQKRRKAEIQDRHNKTLNLARTVSSLESPRPSAIPVASKKQCLIEYCDFLQETYREPLWWTDPQPPRGKSRYIWKTLEKDR